MTFRPSPSFCRRFCIPIPTKFLERIDLKFTFSRYRPRLHNISVTRSEQAESGEGSKQHQGSLSSFGRFHMGPVGNRAHAPSGVRLIGIWYRPSVDGGPTSQTVVNLMLMLFRKTQIHIQNLDRLPDIHSFIIKRSHFINLIYLLWNTVYTHSTVDDDLRLCNLKALPTSTIMVCYIILI